MMIILFYFKKKNDFTTFFHRNLLRRVKWAGLGRFV